MTDRHPRDHVSGPPEEGRASMDEVAQAPFSVVGRVSGLDEARVLIEDLEEHDVPTTAIELLGATTKDPKQPGRESHVAESRAFADVSKSTIAGGVMGIVIGAALGLIMAALIPDLTWPWGLVIGGLFGAGVGGAAGGMSVAKYSSPAWDETYQVEDSNHLAVAVHHADSSTVDRAEEVIRRHLDEGVERRDTESH